MEPSRREAPDESRPPTGPFGVIVPTLDEEETLTGTLAALRRHLGPDDLVVVTDGGSTDGTADVARRHDAVWRSAAPGRGQQLRAGADEAVARGARILVFLHADTELPEGFREAILETLCAGAVGGGFLVRFSEAPPLLRHLGARWINARTRLLRIPLGDQAQFARADAYLRCGGHPPWPILEDIGLLRRLRRRGPIRVVPLRVTTAARRFRRQGMVRTVVLNWAIWTSFALGVSPQRLARFYQAVR